MTITAYELALYSGALFLLFITPGPVWVALIARALSGGFQAAWPLALGVVVGDVIWPVAAIYGISWITEIYGDFLAILKWVAVVIFVVMGISLIRNAGHALGSDSRLTRPGMWAGFIAGVVVILSNPKAVLFYMGVLPGFFDLTTVTTPDVIAIAALSMIVPLLGNLVLAGFVQGAKRFIESPESLRKANIVSGVLLLGVGAVIAVT